MRKPKPPTPDIRLSYDGLANKLRRGAATMEKLAKQVEQLPTHNHVPIAALDELLDAWEPKVSGRAQTKMFRDVEALLHRYADGTEPRTARPCPSCSRMVRLGQGPLCPGCAEQTGP